MRRREMAALISFLSALSMMASQTGFAGSASLDIFAGRKSQEEARPVSVGSLGEAQGRQRRRKASPEKLGIDWISIPGGAFIMGSRIGSRDERPVHRVTVQGFQISKTVVTVRQYRACVEAGACSAPAAPCLAAKFRGDDQPVVCVSRIQAVQFGEWAGGRLPTEAEWEYAARSGGKDRIYPWGDEKPTCENSISDNGALGCGRNATWPVCSKPKGNTEQGLCDMAGNVWEWVQDWYHASYRGAPDDGSSWNESESRRRVVRGGSWFTLAKSGNLRSAVRNGAGPGYRSPYLGFRLCRST